MDVASQRHRDRVSDGEFARVLHELGRITGDVESTRAAQDRQLIEALTREVAALRAAVAHLRAAAGPLPAQLRPALARALLEHDGG